MQKQKTNQCTEKDVSNKTAVNENCYMIRFTP